MERVSFKVAKAIKEAGYPQGDIKITEIGWYNRAGIYTRDLPFLWKGDDMFVAIAPTYLEVWLWLWREKKIVISSDYIDYTSSWMSTIETDEMYTEFHDIYDPEEAIIAAIDYIVDNNLLK